MATDILSNPDDQAAALRAAAAAADRMPTLPAIAITGGKGGVGKTCIAVNLAVMLARLGKRTLLVDGDLGLANADALLGVTPQLTLAEVVLEKLPLADAILPTPHGIDLLPAASGVDQLTRLREAELRAFVLNLAVAARGYESLVIDTAAGIGREVLSLLAASRMCLVVVTPEPTSMTDAYALIKVMEIQHPGRDLRILVNQADDEQHARKVHQRLQQVARSYLRRDLPWVGWLPRDRAVRDAIHRRRPFALGNSDPASQALKTIARRLISELNYPPS
ncbi:MAG: MinD/ParA family protein [Planctomycetota bacterium]|nr:MAG: MinD/ParA family protein [Planctomycetota bacterium]